MKIARLLMNGRTVKQVYELLIKSKEIQMLTVKEITNIQCRFKIDQQERLHENDQESVRLHVEKDKEAEYSIYTYKPIGEINNTVFPGLEKNDFFLVIMTEFQVQQLIKCLSRIPSISYVGVIPASFITLLWR